MNSLLALVLLAVPTAEPPKALSHHYEAPVVRVINQLEETGRGQHQSNLPPGMHIEGYERRKRVERITDYEHSLSYSLAKLTDLCQSTWFSLDRSYKFEGWLVSISADHESIVLANNDKTINVQIKKLFATSQKRILNIVACCDRLTLAINIYGTGPLLVPLPSSRQTLLQRILPEVHEFGVGVWLLWNGYINKGPGVRWYGDREEYQKIPGKLVGQIDYKKHGPVLREVHFESGTLLSRPVGALEPVKKTPKIYGWLNDILNADEESSLLFDISADGKAAQFVSIHGILSRRDVDKMSEAGQKRIATALAARNSIKTWVEEQKELRKNPPKPKFVFLGKYQFGQSEKEIRDMSRDLDLKNADSTRVDNEVLVHVTLGGVKYFGDLHFPTTFEVSKQLIGLKTISGRKYLLTFNFYEDKLYCVTQNHTAVVNTEGKAAEESIYQYSVYAALQSKYGRPTGSSLDGLRDTAEGGVAQWGGDIYGGSVDPDAVHLEFISVNDLMNKAFLHRVHYRWPRIYNLASEEATRIARKKAKARATKLEDDF